MFYLWQDKILEPETISFADFHMWKLEQTLIILALFTC